MRISNKSKDPSGCQAKVKTAVEEVLDKKLPRSYKKDLFKAKCHDVFNLIYKYASEGLKWAA